MRLKFIAPFPYGDEESGEAAFQLQKRDLQPNKELSKAHREHPPVNWTDCLIIGEGSETHCVTRSQRNRLTIGRKAERSLRFSSQKPSQVIGNARAHYQRNKRAHAIR